MRRGHAGPQVQRDAHERAGGQAAAAPPTGLSATALRLQRTLGNLAVQTLVDGVQREAGEDSEALPGAAGLELELQRRRGAGSPLDEQARGFLEPRLGADLGAVRVHTGGPAHALAQAVGAVAFTSGSDLYFSDGAYRPHTPEGLHLLAHEATHALQQARGPVSGQRLPGSGVSVSDPGDAFEREAEAAADAAMAMGEAAPVATQAAVAHAAPAAVQREEDEGWLGALGHLAGGLGTAIGDGASRAWDAGAEAVGTAGAMLDGLPLLQQMAPAAQEAGQGAEQPGLIERARRAAADSKAFQFGSGVVTGGIAGAAPGGFLAAPIGAATGADKHYTPAFRAGYGLGEGAWGVAQILAGIGGEVGGTLLDLTGIGAAVGIPINVLSAVAIAEGAADVGVGASVFMSAWDEDWGGHGPAQELPEGTHKVVDDPNADLTESPQASKVLGDALEAQGMPRPPNHDAHHIVPAGDARGARAAAILEEEGIGLNDAANGVWLPRTSGGAQTPKGITPQAATSHDSVHTKRYFEELTARLERAQAAGDVHGELERIRIALELGVFPH